MALHYYEVLYRDVVLYVIYIVTGPWDPSNRLMPCRTNKDPRTPSVISSSIWLIPSTEKSMCLFDKIPSSPSLLPEHGP